MDEWFKYEEDVPHWWKVSKSWRNEEEKAAWWRQLTPEERIVYAQPERFMTLGAEKINRYHKKYNGIWFAVQAAVNKILKKASGGKDIPFPYGRNEVDGFARVKLWCALQAYAELADIEDAAELERERQERIENE